jgi:uncharacterized protein YjcR
MLGLKAWAEGLGLKGMASRLGPKGNGFKAWASRDWLQNSKHFENRKKQLTP